MAPQLREKKKINGLSWKRKNSFFLGIIQKNQKNQKKKNILNHEGFWGINGKKGSCLPQNFFLKGEREYSKKVKRKKTCDGH